MRGICSAAAMVKNIKNSNLLRRNLKREWNAACVFVLFLALANYKSDLLFFKNNANVIVVQVLSVTFLAWHLDVNLRAHLFSSNIIRFLHLCRVLAVVHWLLLL
jgi:hypothetical protein